MVAGSMVTCTDDASGRSGSNAIWPFHFVNRPRVFETTMWRTEKWIAECDGSMFQTLTAMSNPPVTYERLVTYFSYATDAFVQPGIRADMIWPCESSPTAAGNSSPPPRLRRGGDLPCSCAPSTAA